jgi:hypothetical protein
MPRPAVHPWHPRSDLITGILDALTAGVTVDEIVEHPRTVTAEDIRAAVRFPCHA